MHGEARLLILLAFSIIAAFGQEEHVASSGGFIGGPRLTASVGPGAPVVTGMPYSAEEVTEFIQTLGDGTRLTNTSTAQIYRDSQGRTRIEHSMPALLGQAGADERVIIEISDPVAHVHYTIRPSQKAVYKVVIGTPENGPVRPFAARRAGFAGVKATVPPAKSQEVPKPEQPQVLIEKLGSQTIEGVLVEGTRTTMTWPVGSWMGNDRPITSVNETWTSPELKVSLLTKRNDPRNGETTQRLTNISRTEPDPALFAPPADYTVQEAGPPAAR